MSAPKPIGWTILFLPWIIVGICWPAIAARAQERSPEQGHFASCPEGYFDSLVEEMKKEWPGNRRIRLVAHGHSVPAGYFRTPEVRTFDAYPSLIHRELCDRFPVAVINMVVTAVGGEESGSGAERFERDVLSLQPDLVLIDYALNDRGIGLESAATAWRSMIEACQSGKIRVVLFTPTPDLGVDMDDENSSLAQHANQIRRLAAEYDVPLVDSWAVFQAEQRAGKKLDDLMS
jgi:acyl-CoA thioesterase I